MGCHFLLQGDLPKPGYVRFSNSLPLSGPVSLLVKWEMDQIKGFSILLGELMLFFK